LDERGLLVENVGPWATDKLKIVTDYIQASGAARRRYLGSGAAYIDVFCGPSRSRIRTTGLFIDGSPVAAFKKAKGSLAPFTSINISGADPELLATTEKRLSALGAPFQATPGPASSPGTSSHIAYGRRSARQPELQDLISSADAIPILLSRRS
jgi:hypothetical protein